MLERDAHQPALYQLFALEDYLGSWLATTSLYLVIPAKGHAEARGFFLNRLAGDIHQDFAGSFITPHFGACLAPARRCGASSPLLIDDTPYFRAAYMPLRDWRSDAMSCHAAGLFQGLMLRCRRLSEVLQSIDARPTEVSATVTASTATCRDDKISALRC